MSGRGFVDYEGQDVPDKTIEVREELKSFRVTYRNEAGRRFRVRLNQKPNPIGFHARLPGDRRRDG